MMKLLLRISVKLSLIFLLTGCSMFSPVKEGPMQGYMLDSAPMIDSKLRQSSSTLLVLHPDTNPVYDSKRIAFTLKPHQVTYYNHSHWAQPPAVMLEPLMVKTLQRSKRYKSVLTPPYAGTYSFALRTQIQELRIDYTSRVPVVHMVLQAQLINAKTNNLISSREFSSIVPMSACNPYAAVIAANSATRRILSKMVKWATVNT